MMVVRRYADFYIVWFGVELIDASTGSKVEGEGTKTPRSETGVSVVENGEGFGVLEHRKLPQGVRPESWVEKDCCAF